MSENIAKEENHTQVVVWPGTILGDNTPEDFEKFINETFGVESKFLEIVLTNPDENGPGGRSDLIFTIHDKDVNKFAIPRFQYGMRWLEDVIDNNPCIYPIRIFEYRTW